MWLDTILDTIGNTPLVKLNALAVDLPCTVLAKIEFFNPGGSVKDRIALGMIEAAERDGSLKPGGTIVEGTSGNTGAGLALVAIARGYRCIFTTTDKQSEEKLNVLRALGAEVIVCPTAVAPDDPRSYYSVARRLASEIPNAVYLNQYDHPANTEAHVQTTGPELWEQTEGRITHFFAGAGTGGTISGVGRYLKKQNPDVRIIGIDPFGSVYYKYFHTRTFDEKEIYPYLTEGVGEDILARNMDFDIIDDYVRVTDKEAMLMTRCLARLEGMFVGQSSGMAVAGTLQWLRQHRDEVSKDDVIVVLLPDGGYRYLSKTYNDNWMRNHGFLDRRVNLSAEEVLQMRPRSKKVVSVSPEDTLEVAINRMADHGISQMPVIEGEKVVGGLTEHDILHRLLIDPEGKTGRVKEIMSEPFPVVPRALPMEQLSSYLEHNTSAVLVETDQRGEYEIITRSDLISVLATTGRDDGNRKKK